MKVGIIGGSGLLKSQHPMLRALKKKEVETTAGRVTMYESELPNGAQFYFCQRHSACPTKAYDQPHDINYAAIALAFKELVRLQRLDNAVNV